MKFAAGITLTLALLRGSASAQPTELFDCLSVESATCETVGGPFAITSCNRLCENYYGKIAYFPLRCVGPITVSVETYARWNTRFPLYVEVVPYRFGSEPGICANLPGNVVLIAYGAQNECGNWETAGPVDITSVAPLGSAYAIRIHFFGGPEALSPAMDCVRVTSHPLTEDVHPASWGIFKQLFR